MPARHAPLRCPHCEDGTAMVLAENRTPLKFFFRNSTIKETKIQTYRCPVCKTVVVATSPRNKDCAGV